MRNGLPTSDGLKRQHYKVEIWARGSVTQFFARGRKQLYSSVYEEAVSRGAVAARLLVLKSRRAVKRAELQELFEDAPSVPES